MSDFAIARINLELDYLTTQIVSTEASKAALILIRKGLLELPDDQLTSLSAYGAYVNLTVKSREEWAKIRACLPPQLWTREALGDDKAIKYSYKFGACEIRVTVGELPPSCVLVEEEVFVEERIVPAHKTMKRSIRCQNAKSDIDSGLVANITETIPAADEILF